MAAKDLYSEKKSKAKPYPGATGAAAPRAQSAQRLQGAAPQKEKRKKSPSELGEEALALVLEEETPKFRQPAAATAASKEKTAVGNQKAAQYGGAGRSAAAAPRMEQNLAAAGLDDNAIRGVQWRNDFPSAMQEINQKFQKLDEITSPIHATPEWQELAAAQDLTSAGLDANAQQGLAYGDGLFRLGQKIEEITAPIRATPEWQALAAVQGLIGAGLDANVQLGFGMGQSLGNWLSQVAEDTHLAPGTSLGDYLWDKLKSGMWSGLEGARNGLIDLGEGAARNDLMMQDFERQQYAFLGDAYREHADLNRMWTEQILDSLPEAAEGWRSHKAAEYAQQIDELYDAGGFFRLAGDTASGVGQMVPTVLANVLTGGGGGMAYLYASASGNAAAEARAGGADAETALLYGALSGGVEVLTEQLGGGIPGLNKGVLDDWLMGMAQSNTGRAALKHVINALGEGAEEFISGIVGAYLAKMWNGDERGFWQTMGETLPDAAYQGLVGTLTSACMSVPGNLAETGNARTVDAALNSMQNGETLSNAQLARAEASMQKLIGEAGAESPWSGRPAGEWADAKNRYFDGLFPQAAQDGQSLPKDFIPLPMFDSAAVQDGSALQNGAAAQNGQPMPKDFIPLPMFDSAAAQDSSAMQNGAAVQNGQPVPKDFIPLPMFDSAAAQTVSPSAVNNVPAQLSTEKAAGDGTVQTDTTAATSPEAIAEQNARIRRQALENGKAKGIELDTAEKLTKHTGLKLQYIYDEGSGVDGFVHGDTVTVNLAGDTSAFCVAVHETAHSMKVADAKKFDAFQQSVQRILESDPELGQYAEQVRAAYLAENSPALAGLTNADGTIDIAALEEDVCLKTFERLIGDPEELTQAVAHDRTMIESFLDVLRGIKNSVVIKLTGSEKAMLDEAERTLVNLLRGEAGMVEGERFSIQKDANGESYVLIDTDQELFEGQSTEECIRVAKKYMKEHFQGQVMNVGDSRAFVNGKAIGEYVHPANRRMDTEIKNAKINASTELDNLLAVSKFLRHEDDDGRHADATNGWEVYQTRFVLNGESFVGEVKIKLTDRGKLFYDITHIEKAARID